MADLEDLTADRLTPHVIKTSVQNVSNERTKVLITKLIEHLHDYVRDVDLKPDEWLTAARFLTEVGQKSDSERQEMVLLSDVLGISALVDILNSASAQTDSAAATESSVIGPFHSEDTHQLANGESIGSSGVIGELMLLHGTVRSTDGVPIEGAAVDIWETNGNGFYDMQDPSDDGPNCRGIFHTDQDGRFYLIAIKSVDYNIPSDGPVGELLRLLNRTPTRPAHVHFQLKHPSYVDVTTALYSKDSPHIAEDPVFGVKKSLIKTIKWVDDPSSWIDEYKLKSSLEHMRWHGKGLWVLEHDFVLVKKPSL
ncbi:Intradiol ring-cleavage dioxygenase [Coniochaeta sp. 2T2.1]|nr:Intradiol ring-cleavage dioxygenase [Coniochaeta sp. 2T2.1]